MTGRPASPPEPIQSMRIEAKETHRKFFEPLNVSTWRTRTPYDLLGSRRNPICSRDPITLERDHDVSMHMTLLVTIYSC